MRSRQEIRLKQQTVNEITSYAIVNNLSYYELVAYAYDNDLDDWLKLFNSRTYGNHFKTICLREKYNTSLSEARHKYKRAKALYEQRHSKGNIVTKE